MKLVSIFAKLLGTSNDSGQAELPAHCLDPFLSVKPIFSIPYKYHSLKWNFAASSYISLAVDLEVTPVSLGM